MSDDLRELLAGWLFDFTMRRDDRPARWSGPLGVNGEDDAPLLRDQTVRGAWRAEADKLLAGPLNDWQETFKREHDSLWVSLAQMRGERDEARVAIARVRELADELQGGTAFAGPGVIAHRIRRALDGAT